MEFLGQIDVNIVVLTGAVTSFMAFIMNRSLKAKQWFDKKSSVEKQNWMIVFIVVTALIFFVADCYDLMNTTLTCEPKSIADLIYAILFGGMANQSTYMLSKQKEQ